MGTMAEHERDERDALRPFHRRFFQRDPRSVARELLGCWLWTDTIDGLTGGVIVETEAYLAEGDSACHAARGETRGNRAMFGPSGHAYVYVIHARHCFNIVTEGIGIGSAVLIRALEPRWGCSLMEQRRGRTKAKELTSGPARLCEALGITRDHDGRDLLAPGTTDLGLAKPPSHQRLELGPILSTPRIGVTSAHELEYRYVLAGSRYLSRSLTAKPRKQ